MRRLLVFLKYPSPGEVKTRLAAAIGDEAACAVYRVCAELTLARLGAWRAEATLCVEPPDALERTRAWVGPGWPHPLPGVGTADPDRSAIQVSGADRQQGVGWTLRPQQGDTLGERLAHATSMAFAEGARRVIVIGTDSPWLSSDDIEAAFGALNRAELILGPAEDGGYYLIGLSRPTPALFTGIAWSTAAVYQETITKARVLGLRVHALPLGYDVDRLEDVHRFVADERARGVASQLIDTLELYGQTTVTPH